MEELKTTVEITNALVLKGYTHNFRMTHAGTLECLETQERFTPDQVEIVEHYRTEGPSDPADMMVIYAITAGTMKGVLTDAFGTYADSNLSGFIQQVEKRRKSGEDHLDDETRA